MGKNDITKIKATMNGDKSKIEMEGDIREILTLVTTILHELYKKNEVKKGDIEMVCRLATSSQEEIRNEVAKIVYDKLMAQFLEDQNVKPEDLQKFMEEKIGDLDLDKILEK